MYKPGGVVVLEVNVVPVFGIIRNILVVNAEDYYLICEILYTELFNCHFHSYAVCNNATEYAISKVECLADHYYLSCYKYYYRLIHIHFLYL